MNEEEAANAPELLKSKMVDMTGMPGMKFAMTVSTLDCTGCGSCASVCPGRKGEKALTMQPIDTQREGQKSFDYGRELAPKAEVFEKFKPNTVKGSQFKQPLLEFSGACAAAARPRMQSWSPSCSATECISPTQRAAPPSGAVPHRACRTRRMPLAMVRLGPIPFLKTTPNTDLACIWHPGLPQADHGYHDGAH